MGLLIVLQVLVDLAFIAISTLLLIERSKARTAEDPRMSRGLQMLTSKIAILQDLMDRSETTGRQLGQILDNKQAEVQERIEEVEVHLHKIQRATEKSHEVAKIFQDRIPHQEIIERQNSLKYLQAAKMANQGFSVDDIARKFDIPRGELELIVKVNRDRILNTDSPAWLETTKNKENDIVTAQERFEASAKAGGNTAADRFGESTAHPSEFVIQNLQQGAREMDVDALKRLLNEVRRDESLPAPVVAASPGAHAAPIIPAHVAPQAVAPAALPVAAAQSAGLHFKSGKTPKTIDSEIRPVVFKKISVIDDLG